MKRLSALERKSRLVLILVLIVCMIPTMACAKNYNGWDVYNDDIDLNGVVLKKGDKLTKNSNVSVEVIFKDAAGNELESTNGAIKAIKVGDETVSEWVIVDKWASIIALGSWMQAAVAFELEPAYAAADSDGYYTISSHTYDVYKDLENIKDRQVKTTGTYVTATADALIISVADGMCVALNTTESFSDGDRIHCKGTIAGAVDYEGATIPVIGCTEASVQMYDPLKNGDKGEAVTEMKLRMQELGYFKAGASLSDEYNGTCVDRMKQFQEKNGLPATGDADVETLTVLFSDSAISK